MPLSLTKLNVASPQQCRALLAPMIERAPWLLEAVPEARPFPDVEAVADAIEAAIRDATPGDRLRLLRGHPELAGSDALAGKMTAESKAEQGRLGLATLPADDQASLAEINASYRTRFGWPYIVALHRKAHLSAIEADWRRRLQAAPAVEVHNALNEVVSVMRNRCRTMIVAETPIGDGLQGIVPAEAQ
jgi:2-oxo-4-hydroxy-4-carboxy-5-ureidoimidazoline decarboxylase